MAENDRNNLVIATSLRFPWLKCVLLTLLLHFGSPSVQHPQAVHVIWPSLLRSKAWQTRSAATPPMPLLGKLLKLQWYSRKSFAVSEKKTWKGPNICDSHLLDSSLASFLGGTMVYGNTEKVILLLPGKPHPARRLLAIFHGRHLTRTPFKSWALKQPATISYTFSNIAAHETT